MKVIHVKAFLLPVLVLIVTMITTILLVPKDIAWIHYPLDALGAQDYELAWIFNYGLMMTGVLMMMIATLYHHKMNVPQAITYTMLMFSLSMILMGVWKNENLFEYNPLHSDESLSHQRFYILTHISYLLCIVVHVLLSKQKTMRHIHLLMCFILVTFYIIDFATDSYQGIIHSIQGLVMLLWIPMFYGRFEYHVNVKRL